MMNRTSKFYGMGGHDCRDVIAKVEELIDGELDTATQERLIREIEKCPSCLQHYDLDKSFKEFVSTRVERKCCAERIKQEILEKIKNYSPEGTN